MPSLSRPTSFTFAARPTAMSTCSASIVPASVVTRTPLSPAVTDCTFTPVFISILRRAKTRASCAETSSSSIGTMRGSASSSVTAVPYVL